MENKESKKKIEPDRFVRALLASARGTVETGSSAIGMLVGTKDGEELLAVMLPWSKEEEDKDMARYMKALSMALFAGCDTIYELRDAYIRVLPKETTLQELQDSDHPAPSEDPLSENALFVTRVHPEEMSTEMFTQKYRISDDGTPDFDEVEGHEFDLSQGRLAEIVNVIIEGWKKSGRPSMTIEELKPAAVRSGFTGRVGGEIIGVER